MRKMWLMPLIMLTLIFWSCDEPGEEEKIIPTDNTDWEIIHTMTNQMPVLMCGDMLPGEQFIAVGGSGGYIAISSNGGTTWDDEKVSTTMDTAGFAVLAIQFANTQVGVVGGEKSLYYTTNGGNTWLQSDADFIGTQDVDILQYISGNTFYAVCGTLFAKSNDAGATWDASVITFSVGESVLVTGAKGMDFYDLNYGILSTDKSVALYTSDGGASWQPESLGTDTIFYDVCALSPDTFFMCGQEGYIIRRFINGTGNPDWIYAEHEASVMLWSMDIHGNNGIAVGPATGQGVVFTSQDRGLHWEPISSANIYGDVNWARYTSNGDGVLVVGSDILRGGGAVRIGTSDLTSWTSVNYGTILPIQDIAFTDAQNGIIVTTKRGFYVTMDGGLTLYQRLCAGELDSSIHDVTISAVSYINSTNAIAVADSTIIRTADGGDTWNVLPEENITVEEDIVHLNNIQMVSANVGYIIGGDGLVLKTTDGGQNWAQLDMSPELSVTAELMDLCFIDENTGWIVGGTGTILKTTDGGSTWDIQDAGVINGLTGVWFTGGSNGWICGNMVILRTSNGGSTWTSSPIEPNLFAHFRDIGFIDNQKGWIVGDYGYVLHTVDGGETWYRQAVGYTETNLYSIEILNSSQIWTAGELGTIMKLKP